MKGITGVEDMMTGMKGATGAEKEAEKGAEATKNGVRDEGEARIADTQHMDEPDERRAQHGKKASHLVFPGLHHVGHRIPGVRIHADEGKFRRVCR